MQKIGAHGVDLPLDGIARDGPFGPAFGNHRPDPLVVNRKQRRCLNRFAGRCMQAFGVQRIAVQCEVRRSCNNGAGKYCLELGSRFKPLHLRQALAQERQTANCPQKPDLDGQALAAFGATGSDHCAAATRFHARQKAVRTCALDFGRLVCAFHDKSYSP